MKSFTHWNPTRVAAGPDALASLAPACTGKRTMVMYGGGSARANGSLDAVKDTLRAAEVDVVEYGGVTVCSMESIGAATKFAREQGVQAVIGLGGASVMDTAKAVSFCAVHDGYERYLAHELPQNNDEKLTLVLVPTYPSTGAEADGVSDIIGFSGGVSNVWPTLSVLYPPFTYSMDGRSTALSTMVILAQTGYCYFTDTNPISRGATVATLRAVLEAYDAILADPQDEDARGTMMWASFLETYGLAGVGVTGTWMYSIFSAGKMMRLAMGTSYREGLAMMLPRWIVAEAAKHPDDVRAFAVDVFGAKPDIEPSEAARMVHDALMDLMRRGGAPLTLDEYGVLPDDATIDAAIAGVSSPEFTPAEYRMLLEAYRSAEPAL